MRPAQELHIRLRARQIAELQIVSAQASSDRKKRRSDSDDNGHPFPFRLHPQLKEQRHAEDRWPSDVGELDEKCRGDKEANGRAQWLGWRFSSVPAQECEQR